MKKYIPFFYLIFLVTSCGGLGEDEVARQVSPSGKVEAVLYETNGGATTSFGYEVYIKHTDQPNIKTKVASLYGTVRSSNAYGLNLIWVSNESLELQYLETKTAKLTKPTIELNKTIYKISLKSGVMDTNAPPGGMLYNLHGRPYGK